MVLSLIVYWKENNNEEISNESLAMKYFSIFRIGVLVVLIISIL